MINEKLGKESNQKKKNNKKTEAFSWGNRSFDAVPKIIATKVDLTK